MLRVRPGSRAGKRWIVLGLPHEILLTAKKGLLKGQTMKKTVGICMLVAVSALASSAFAAPRQADAGVARWSASAMERHLPVDGTRLHQEAQKKFRYMDMAEGRRSRFMRDAVLLYGHGAGKGGKDAAGEPAKAAPPAPAVRAIMRPMT